MALLGGCATSPHHTSGAPTSSAIGTPSSSAATTATCSAPQLRATVAFVPVGAGSDQYRIKIVDVGRPCSLSGRPTSLIGVLRTGDTTTLRPERLSADDIAGMTTGRAARLRPGTAAEVVLLTTIGCPSGQHAPTPSETFASLRLGLRSGLVQVRYGGGPERGSGFGGVWLPCGVAMSNFYAAM